jgi:HCO3- transporter family
VLQKGHGYHLDLFVLAFLIAVCSAMGLPWFVAATVRSITHVKSLMRESEVKIPGERPQIVGVRYQLLILNALSFKNFSPNCLFASA